MAGRKRDKGQGRQGGHKQTGVRVGPAQQRQTQVEPSPSEDFEYEGGQTEENESAQAEPAYQETQPEYKIKTMAVGISKSRQELHAKFVALALKLGCRTSELLWYAVGQLVAKPPEVIPAGIASATGSAPGFWVVADTDDTGKATGLRVIEVERRAEESGHSFYRYREDDEKARLRAMNQAIRAAAYNLTLLGFSSDSVEISELEPMEA